MGRDGDRAGASVATRGSAPRGAGDRVSDLLVAAVADAPDAPQRGDREICKLSVFSASFIRLCHGMIFSDLTLVHSCCGI
jgi:hypothetical protein